MAVIFQLQLLVILDLLFVKYLSLLGCLLVVQMMDNNYDVHFSCGGCLVQDQVSRKVIARGPKVGRLFPLQFTILRTLSLASIIVENKAEV